MRGRRGIHYGGDDSRDARAASAFTKGHLAVARGHLEVVRKVTGLTALLESGL